MKSDEVNSSGCPLHFAMHMFGDKWSLLIIRDIMFFGKRHYNEFLGSREKISTNILADRLSSLEKKGILTKTKEQGKKPYYQLTAKGLELMPVLMSIISWAGKYDNNCIISDALLKKVKNDPEGMQEEFTKLYHQNLPVNAE